MKEYIDSNPIRLLQTGTGLSYPRAETSRELTGPIRDTTIIAQFKVTPAKTYQSEFLFKSVAVIFCSMAWTTHSLDAAFQIVHIAVGRKT
jgi:hypothetical protein